MNIDTTTAKKPAGKQDLFHLGPYPSRHPNVLYERKTPKLFVETKPSEEENSWLGFDAVEIKDQRMFIHYWLDFTWRASLNFDSEDDFSSFRPVRQADKGWQIVKKHVSEETWETTGEMIKKGAYTYIISYDPTLTQEEAAETNKAKDFLHVDITLTSFLNV